MLVAGHTSGRRDNKGSRPHRTRASRQQRGGAYQRVAPMASELGHPLGLFASNGTARAPRRFVVVRRKEHGVAPALVSPPRPAASSTRRSRAAPRRASSATPDSKRAHRRLEEHSRRCATVHGCRSGMGSPCPQTSPWQHIRICSKVNETAEPESAGNGWNALARRRRAIRRVDGRRMKQRQPRAVNGIPSGSLLGPG